MLALAPSDIHFLQGGNLPIPPPDEDALTVLSRRFLEGRIPCKVQVAEKDGAWFALNSSTLHIARALERKGQGAHVGVEVVPLARVPKTLQEGMVVPPQPNASSDSTDCSGCWSESEDSSSYTSSDYTDDDDESLSDSEYEDCLTCSMCERRFDSLDLLEQHKRSRCHRCFSTTASSLQGHKNHPWSADGIPYESDLCSDGKRPSEETERLL